MSRSVAECSRERSVTREELIERSGLDAQRVDAILQGRWTPTPAERQRVAAALGVAIDEIAWGHVTPIQHLHGHGPG